MIALLLFSQFSLADSLYENGYYELAHIEYERIFFSNPKLKMNPDKRLNNTDALLQFNNAQGIEALQLMKPDFPELEPELNIKMARGFIKRGDYYQARALLKQTEEKKLLGLTYLLDDHPLLAHDVFLNSGDHEIAQEIQLYIRKPKKSPETAVLLSIICPGAGEIYAGNTRLGIMDFLLNLGSGYLMYNALRQKKYVDATLVFTFLFQRFYRGSIYNAQRSALAENEKQRQTWLEHIYYKHFACSGIEY